MKSVLALIAAKRKKWWPYVQFIGGLGLAALAFNALNGQRDELIGATSALSHLRIEWFALGACFEILSLACFGLLQRRLLHAGGVAVRAGEATALSLAAGAIASSVPAGPAFASVFAYHLYRRRGANDAFAAWTLLATLVCAALSLGVVATVGVLLAFGEGKSYDLIGVILGVLVITLVADAIVLQRRWLAWLLVRCVAGAKKLTGRPRRPAGELVGTWQEKLAAVKLRRRDLAATFGFGLGNWLFDCSALLMSFAAVGAPIPWRGLLLSYGAAQLAANLPITPGGLGVVEGSLTIALVAFGGAEVSTVAAVLCYRILSFWGYLPIGWSSWLVLEARRRREEHAVPHLVRLPGGLGRVRDARVLGVERLPEIEEGA